jgi:hypothetical protein
MAFTKQLIRFNLGSYHGMLGSDVFSFGHDGLGQKV